MKVWISLGMEGAARIVDREQCQPGNPAYAFECELLRAEVDAATTGAIAGGTTEFVSADHVTCEEIEPFATGAVPVVTKEPITRASALSLHPDESCRPIAAGAKATMDRVAAGEVPLPGVSRPATLNLDGRTADMARVATWGRGAARTAGRAVRIEGADLLGIFSSSVALTYITRQAGGR
jgi:D-amino peptidase